MIDDLAPYLSGQRLYGDDFNPQEIEHWFADEAETSFDLGDLGVRSDYPWAVQQDYHCFSRLPRRRWEHVLGFGSASGVELRPLDARRATILESSERYEPDPQLRFPVSYIRADPLGQIALPDGSVDLIVCFGVLHHVPNVSRVLAEFARVCLPGGYVVIVEPVTSMGDWRQSRPNLTPRERGIPAAWMKDRLGEVGFEIQRFAYCETPLKRILERVTKRPVNSETRLFVRSDAALCAMLSWRANYHAVSALQKIRPTTGTYVARRAQG